MPPSEHEAQRCPSCNELSAQCYLIPETPTKSVPWHFCQCGTVYHTRAIDPKVWANGYRDQYTSLKQLEDRLEHIRRVYLPLIEEDLFGRRFLDVGPTVLSHVEALRAQGWLAKAIDLIPLPKQIQGDFETYAFANDARYDLIFMHHVLESFQQPVKALEKAHQLLNPSGVLFLMTMDAEIIYQTGIKQYGAFAADWSRCFFSERELIRQLERIGFEIILRRKNLSRRFLVWNDVHIIAKKSHIRGLDE